MHQARSRGDQREDIFLNHPGQARQETAEAKASRLGREQLRLLGWSQSDLAARRKHGVP